MAGMVCLECKNCVIHTLCASGVSFSRWGAIQIYVPLPLHTHLPCLRIDPGISHHSQSRYQET